MQDNAKDKGKTKYSKAFITEDLAPSRSSLLWYMKKRCDGKFLQCHTKEGRIKAKVRGGDDKWITVSNPDDLYKHHDEIDIDELNKNNKKYQILDTVEVPNLDFTVTINDTSIDESD